MCAMTSKETPSKHLSSAMAIDVVRSENRRRRREQIAITRQQDEMDTSTDDLDWEELEPVIDEALSKLNEGDRALVIARYYQKRPHAETASALGISEDAARMRTKRALGKLRNALGKRGVATSTALLGSAVAANAVSPAPAALSATVCKAGLAAAASAAGVGTTATALALLKANLATVAALAVGVPIVALQFAENKRLSSDLQTLQTELQESGAPAQPTALPSATRAGGKTLADILADPDPLGRLRALLGYVDEVGNDAIPGVLVELRDNAPSWDPDAGIAARLLLTRWAKDDPGAAFAYVEGLDYRQGAGDAFVVLGALAAADPQRAVEWLADPSNRLSHLPGLPEKLAGTITREWVRQDPAAAFAWAKSAPDHWRNGALTGVIGTIAADPDQAVALALQVEPGQERGMLIDQIAESWAQAFAARRRSRGQSTLDGTEARIADSRSRARRLVVERSRRGRGSICRLDDLPRAANDDPTWSQTVTESWARQEPAAAADLGRLPSRERREDVLPWGMPSGTGRSPTLRRPPPGC